MHNYDSMKQKYAKRVSQTIDSPIMVFDYFELSEMMVALLCLLLFGIIFYSWKLMFLSLFLVLGVGPVMRRRNKKGFFFHWPYRNLGMRLPGMINPKKTQYFSD